MRCREAGSARGFPSIARMSASKPGASRPFRWASPHTAAAGSGGCAAEVVAVPAGSGDRRAGGDDRGQRAARCGLAEGEGKVVPVAEVAHRGHPAAGGGPGGLGHRVERGVVVAGGARGIPHAFANRAQDPLRIMIMWIPGGAEGLFLDMTEYLHTAGAAADPQAVADLQARYGATHVGPPIPIPVP